MQMVKHLEKLVAKLALLPAEIGAVVGLTHQLQDMQSELTV
jgi:hypothetical protein